MKKTTWKRILAAALAALTFALLAAGCGIKKIDGTGTETGAVAQTPQQNPAGNEQPTSGVGGEPAGTAEPTDPQTEPQTEPAEPALDASFAPEDAEVDQDLLANALALALRGWEEGYLNDPNGVWSVIGYYAALKNRVDPQGERGSWLSENNAAFIEERLLPEKQPPIPEGWFSEGGGAARENRETERDGKTVLVPGYSFWGYDDMLASMLGVWREIAQTRTDREDGFVYTVTLTDHLDGGAESAQFRFRFTVGETGNWVLSDILYPSEPRTALDPDDEERLAKALGVELPGWSESLLLNDPGGVWSILGHYAALRSIENDAAGSFLSDEEAALLQRVLRPGLEFLPLPDNWLEDGRAERVTVHSGDAGWIDTEGLTFPDIDGAVREMLGQSLEVTAERADGVDERAYRVTVTGHYGDWEETYAFEFGFSKFTSFDGYVFWGLNSIEQLDEPAYTVPEEYDTVEGANFTISQVREANSVLKLLEIYGSVQLQMNYGSEYMSILALDRGGVVVESTTYTYFDPETGESDSFGGGAWIADGLEASFSSYEGETTASAWFDGDMAESETDSLLTSFIGYGKAELVADNGNTVSFTVTDPSDPDSGASYTCTVDAGTLALLSYTLRIDGEEISASTTLGGEVEEPEVFSAFDQTRAVTVHLDTYNGWDNAVTKTWHVPAAWDFIVYFDNGEVQLFEFSNLSEPLEGYIPATGADQEFWASAAKG